MYLYRQPDSQLAAWHGFGEPPPRATQIYAAQSRVRELTDRGFQNIFLERNKLIVVAFWAESCRPCDAVASTVVSVAERIAQGSFANHVKFYHAQWDPAVNPRLHRQYGFGKIPVVYFYYTSSGRQPSKAAPLLEAATGGDRFEADAAKYLRNIETILRRHGHVPPTATIAESRGWISSRSMIDAGDFEAVDRMIVAPSPVQKYLVDAYRANPRERLSKVAKVRVASSYNAEFQRIHGKAPDADDMGMLDPVSRIVYLLSVRRLEVYLNTAVHEAVHLFTCRSKGRHIDFYYNYGRTFNEGFTQLVTEEILRAQKVTMSKAPYANERAVAAKLVEVLGFSAVADDYFRCTRNIHTALEAKRLFGPIVVLRKEAEETTSNALKEQKYREIIRLLGTLRKP